MQILLAFGLDLVIGDSLGSFHPTCWIGKFIAKLENILTKRAISSWKGRAFGFLMLVVVSVTVWFITWLVVRLFAEINSLFGMLISIFLISTTVATKELFGAARRVFRALEKGDLERARRLVGEIVGRDTHSLSEEEVVKATIESVAENTVDGIISPLFFAILGGAPWAMLYRAVNTLDSMVGYKNDKYQYLGWASARADDLLNFIPARIGSLLMIFAAMLLKKNFREALKTTLKEGNNHPSPNSGLTEAAAAGALGVRLGGPRYYQGVLSFHPYLGDELKAVEIKDIKEILKISFASSIVVVVLFELMNYLIFLY